MDKLEKFARLISDKRSDIRFGIYIVSQIAIIVKAKYMLAIVSSLTILAIMTCCCQMFSIRHENLEASLCVVLRKSLYNIVFTTAMLAIWFLTAFYSDSPANSQ